MDNKKINDRLYSIELIAQSLLSEVSNLREQLGVVNNTLSQKLAERKAKTNTILLRRRKAIDKKINRGKDKI